ncbi:hypothetical protein H696_05821 [Fonticula alba]|uniref:Uncharacterized protein n=1 Tax=Fonticula alba TaxID=691883 RepID=A0A058Z195_FONAL|nr:hypothetical protein H696_05821 [Fonticula alba]KCV67713.1 hypothetical protein H696_05821 [Fonticula alba]|eukprot:XP_009497897.1 hypothetical protein H696_05821 [Fonticula alba]
MSSLDTLSSDLESSLSLLGRARHAVAAWRFVEFFDGDSGSPEHMPKLRNAAEFASRLWAAIEASDVLPNVLDAEPLESWGTTDLLLLLTPAIAADLWMQYYPPMKASSSAEDEAASQSQAEGSGTRPVPAMLENVGARLAAMAACLRHLNYFVERIETLQGSELAEALAEAGVEDEATGDGCLLSPRALGTYMRTVREVQAAGRRLTDAVAASPAGACLDFPVALPNVFDVEAASGDGPAPGAVALAAGLPAGAGPGSPAMAAAEEERRRRIALYKRNKALTGRIEQLAGMLFPSAGAERAAAATVAGGAGAANAAAAAAAAAAAHVGAGDDAEDVLGQDADESTLRSFLLATLALLAPRALAHARAVADELPMLTSRAVHAATGVDPRVAAAARAPPLRTPVRLMPDNPHRRAALQEQVFRPGHRLPTMTISEYLDREAQRGGHISGGGPEGDARAAREAEEKLQLEGTDAYEDAARLKAIESDKFTDYNKRGSGNTYNRS